jgi:hypothetical protein
MSVGFGIGVAAGSGVGTGACAAGAPGDSALFSPEDGSNVCAFRRSRI